MILVPDVKINQVIMELHGALCCESQRGAATPEEWWWSPKAEEWQGQLHKMIYPPQEQPKVSLQQRHWLTVSLLLGWGLGEDCLLQKLASTPFHLYQLQPWQIQEWQKQESWVFLSFWIPQIWSLLVFLFPFSFSPALTAKQISKPKWISYKYSATCCTYPYTLVTGDGCCYLLCQDLSQSVHTKKHITEKQRSNKKHCHVFNSGMPRLFKPLHLTKK